MCSTSCHIGATGSLPYKPGECKNNYVDWYSISKPKKVEIVMDIVMEFVFTSMQINKIKARGIYLAVVYSLPGKYSNELDNAIR
jgi:hypothetical protein